MTKVLITDDHAIVRRGLRQILSECSGRYTVGEASHANEAIRRVRAEHWDLLLFDIHLPGKSGLDAIKQIKGEKPDARVLAISVDPEDHCALRALRAGAAGYVSKSSPPEAIVAAVRRVAAGGKYITQALAERLASAVGTNPQRAAHENLTDREFQIFRMLAGGQTVSEIASELSLSVKTISTHRGKVLHKLNLRNNAELMRYFMHQVSDRVTIDTREAANEPLLASQAT